MNQRPLGIEFGNEMIDVIKADAVFDNDNLRRKVRNDAQNFKRIERVKNELICFAVRVDVLLDHVFFPDRVCDHDDGIGQTFTSCYSQSDSLDEKTQAAFFQLRWPL